jgi:hypothetical protein
VTGFECYKIYSFLNVGTTVIFSLYATSNSTKLEVRLGGSNQLQFSFCFTCLPLDPMDPEAAVKLLEQQNTTLASTQPYLLKLGAGLFIVADIVIVIVKPTML